MLPIRVRSFSAFSTSVSSIFKNTCRNRGHPGGDRGVRSKWVRSPKTCRRVKPSYLGEPSLFGLLQGEDPSALQEAAEGQTLALAHRGHLPPGTQAAVGLVELEDRRGVSEGRAGGRGRRRRSTTHLPQDHLSAPSAADQQQQAADQQLLLEGEALAVAAGRHAVAVNLGEHAGHLGKADLGGCGQQRRRGGQPLWTCPPPSPTGQSGAHLGARLPGPTPSSSAPTPPPPRLSWKEGREKPQRFTRTRGPRPPSLTPPPPTHLHTSKAFLASPDTADTFRAQN